MALFALGFGAAGCASPAEAPALREEAPSWSVPLEQLDSALMSVWGTSADDVWAVGGDRGEGPLVLHYDGAGFERLDTGTSGDLWWVFGFEGGPVFMGGARGTVLRYADGAFERLETPSDEPTVFGVWGSSAEDMWAVGGADGGASGAFAWRLDGDVFREPSAFPAELATGHAFWKVWGSAADDAWLVGTGGLTAHFDGSSFTEGNVGGGESLFTVHYGAGRFVAVGGGAAGHLFEHTGAAWERVDDTDLQPLNGVHLVSEELGYAVGRFGSFVEERAGKWRDAPGPDTLRTLHAVWVDPDGGVWTVGGELDVRPVVGGVLAYRGGKPPVGVMK